jgi:hypothetical protein
MFIKMRLYYYHITNMLRKFRLLPHLHRISSLSEFFVFSRLGFVEDTLFPGFILEDVGSLSDTLIELEDISFPSFSEFPSTLAPTTSSLVEEHWDRNMGIQKTL